MATRRRATGAIWAQKGTRASGNAQNVRLWWAKANEWTAWQEVGAVREAYQKAKAQQARPQRQEAWEAPTPPPIASFRANRDPILSAEEEFKRAEAQAKRAF